MATKEGEARIAALGQLREAMPVGTTVYTVLRHTSASGMSRDIELITIEGNEPRRWSNIVKVVWGERNPHKRDGIRVSGCGSMDMGYHLVNSLSRTLYPSGYDDADGHHKDGGYALKHRWI